MHPLLSGKVAVITGAGAGIGRASALVFARAGAKVVVSDIQGTEQTVALVRQAGGDAIGIDADVSNPEQVRKLMDQAVAHYGRLDCAFNNAGIEGQAADTHESSLDNWHRTLAINLTGTYLCMAQQIPHMLKQGGGSIVNMSSVAGLVGYPSMSAYVASKHGVLGLTKAAALEYASRNVRINAVCPGVIHTAMVDRVTHKDPAREAEIIAGQAMARMGRPEEVAEAALWLCSEASSFVTGHCMTIDGGYTAA